jgi:hypothetical protein
LLSEDRWMSVRSAGVRAIGGCPCDRRVSVRSVDVRAIGGSRLIGLVLDATRRRASPCGRLTGASGGGVRVGNPGGRLD